MRSCVGRSSVGTSGWSRRRPNRGTPRPSPVGGAAALRTMPATCAPSSLRADGDPYDRRYISTYRGYEARGSAPRATGGTAHGCRPQMEQDRRDLRRPGVDRRGDDRAELSGRVGDARQDRRDQHRARHAERRSARRPPRGVRGDAASRAPAAATPPRRSVPIENAVETPATSRARWRSCQVPQDQRAFGEDRERVPAFRRGPR